MNLCDTAVLSILLHSKQKFRCVSSESANVSPLSISFVQVSPKEVDNPSVSAIREAREEAGVIGNEKKERRQKLMSGRGRVGSPSLLVRCQTQHTGQLKERERGGGCRGGGSTILWPLLALQFCDQASLVVFSGCLRTLKEDTGRGSL